MKKLKFYVDGADKNIIVGMYGSRDLGKLASSGFDQAGSEI
ncbi:hypothetical protein [Sneathiella sp.]|jgi:hypothetical protein